MTTGKEFATETIGSAIARNIEQAESARTRAANKRAHAETLAAAITEALQGGDVVDQAEMRRHRFSRENFEWESTVLERHASALAIENALLERMAGQLALGFITWEQVTERMIDIMEQARHAAQFWPVEQVTRFCAEPHELNGVSAHPAGGGNVV